ncbi:MAG: sugar phosphate isomerase/epimerase [Clostridia bacterium]|nr:sugar phosphate isomerase/epimerase [Clostridia bacterium]
MKIGAQFYTLRDKATNLDDFADALKRVADIGYTEVQISGVCKYEPEWLNEQLNKTGLKCVLTHWGVDDIRDNPVDVVNAHKIFDCKNIGIGCMPGGLELGESHLVSFIENFTEPAKIIYENGAKLFYHNHDMEFRKCADGDLIINKILEAFPKEHLGITMDTYWVEYAGHSASEWLDRMTGRVECVHLKDLKMVGEEKRMAPVGYGELDFEKIIAHASDAGARHLLVEQDHTYGEDPFECLEKSYKYLKSLGLN